MLTGNETRLERELFKELARVRQDTLENIAGGGIGPDRYNFLTGYVRCLDNIAELVKEIRRKLEQD